MIKGSMDMTIEILLAISLSLCLFGLVQGHGRLIDPPSRSSMWRYGYRNPPNYNDNQLYCGGVQIQYEVNGGRCGVCGDPFQGPLDNEPGGKYANGIIVYSTTVGAIMPVTVELTAPHKGYMEFRLCPNDDPRKKITQKCLDDFLLTIIESKSTRYPVTIAGKYKFKLQLPESVRCRNCVLQWRYNTGNSWGVDPKTNRGCIGCGNQEQFYGCSDIAIGYTDLEPGFSLITNQMSKGDPIYQPGVPTPPLVPTELMTWGPGSPESGEVDPVVVPGSSESSSNVAYKVYKNFLDFQSQFPNKYARPCVCHSCVGKTCVCECFEGDFSASSTNHLQSYLMLTVFVMSFLLQRVLY
ncbi:uncharacterized protein LOC125669290 isoform X3 [Ostrea edulis]|uniref:uncharacterized protein LOC125669290 isoform X3 n=1 Tax=Ostrea edulis TaxID=37623 RepID=UPI002094817A|nr:uncharacterized protein LOC125669290 isoform X3 [Ostrea edulis]